MSKEVGIAIHIFNWHIKWTLNSGTLGGGNFYKYLNYHKYNMEENIEVMGIF